MLPHCASSCSDKFKLSNQVTKYFSLMSSGICTNVGLSFPGAILSAPEGNKSVEGLLQYGNVRLTVVPARSQLDDGTCGYDGELNLYAADDMTAQVLNCGKGTLRGYIQSLGDEITFYVCSGPYNWQGFIEFTCSLVVKPSAIKFYETYPM